MYSKAIKRKFRRPTNVSSLSSFHSPWNMNESNRCFIPLRKEFSGLVWPWCMWFSMWFPGNWCCLFLSKNAMPCQNDWWLAYIFVSLALYICRKTITIINIEHEWPHNW